MKAAIILALAMATPAGAEETWSYRDWRVSVIPQTSGDDDWLECTARTGGDGMPTVSVSLTSQDAGPPTVNPPVTYLETAPRHYLPLYRDHDQAVAVFDDGDSTTTVAQSGLNDEGLVWARAVFNGPATDNMLHAMHRNGLLEFTAPGKDGHYSFSLNGFTAAYLKAMDRCGFDGAATFALAPD
ncbi:hypothetical protein BFP70_09805 [Thioclava sp. SK-1]|uniref:hypothetical protein n=1 Tax=Thioclava sp. SK-1 TaxID=1889770 RepID=UPI00082603B7|nr:hypothetical protein [Thioclava sp. SK-1]OCX65352.1 hypothetical protein BFP70_09805 [Thioclava sp. SK-1]